MPNFNALPPEVNVSNIQGPGSKPIRTAQTAWESLAKELASAADGWGTQVSATQDSFKGPAAGYFLQAAKQYHAWLYNHAYTANCTAASLDEAAQAYDRAVRSMVPTSTIVANRAATLTMKTTNLLGQFANKIAELDRRYERMWARNANAMHEYQFAAFELMRQVEEKTITPAPLVVHGFYKPFGSCQTTIEEDEG
ncbi:PPE family protein [Mycobacterium haemophilum]